MFLSISLKEHKTEPVTPWYKTLNTVAENGIICEVTKQKSEI